MKRHAVDRDHHYDALPHSSRLTFSLCGSWLFRHCVHVRAVQRLVTWLALFDVMHCHVPLAEQSH